jgi:flagellar hook-associated protein 3 FlgL
MGSQIAALDTFAQTASNQGSMLQMTDTTLGEVVTQLTSAVSLAVSASNGTLNSSNLQAILQQASGIRDQVLSLANASYQGNYLFSGSQGSTQPFSLDSSTAPATAPYAGDTSVQYIMTPGGQKIQMNLPGSAIFTSAFTTLNQFISDLSSGASAATISADSNAISDALNTVSTQRSLLNGSLSTLNSTSTYTQTQQAQLAASQSTLVAADTAGIATSLKTNQTQYQAMLSVISSLNSTNLFDYLK